VAGTIDLLPYAIASAIARSFRPRGPKLLVGLSRFELLTPRLSSVCSNQLSYRPLKPANKSR
jgi:hypothetical protein